MYIPFHHSDWHTKSEMIGMHEIVSKTSFFGNTMYVDSYIHKSWTFAIKNFNYRFAMQPECLGAGVGYAFVKVTHTHFVRKKKE